MVRRADDPGVRAGEHRRPLGVGPVVSWWGGQRVPRSLGGTAGGETRTRARSPMSGYMLASRAHIDLARAHQVATDPVTRQRLASYRIQTEVSRLTQR